MTSFVARTGRRALQMLLGSFCLCFGMASAATFDIAVLPSRFELATQSGKRLGQSIDIHNMGLTATEVSIRSLDWTYSAEGDIAYFDELRDGSCRPWVTLERRTLSVPPRADDTGKAPAPPTYPLKASGLLDWERGSFKVNAEFK